MGLMAWGRVAMRMAKLYDGLAKRKKVGIVSLIEGGVSTVAHSRMCELIG